MARPGRRRKAGRRKPSGDLVQANDGDVRAPTLWRRIKDGAVKGGVHPYAGTVLGRLSIFGILSDAEVEAGFRVAEIVARHERCCGMPRRSAASPAYQRSYGAALDPEDDPDQVRKARRAARKYQLLIDEVPDRGRDPLFTVCVDDREISALLHKDLQAVLRRLAVSFGFASGQKSAA